MRVGIAVIRGGPWAELAERARTIEDAGFDVLMTGDHMRHPFDATVEFLDGWTVLAAWGTVTRYVRLGMLVSNVIYRNPALLAKQAVAVDHVSGGRLDLGIGSGLFDTDQAMAGVPAWTLDERIERTDEVVRIVDRLLRGVVDDFRGRWYSVGQASMAPGPVQQPRPPIVIGANHPRMLKLVAQRADTWNTFGGYGLDDEQFFALTAKRVAFVDRICLELGRDPATLGRSVLVHHSAFQPWRSPDQFASIVERFQDLGFDECLMYWPEPHERAVFDRVATEVLPELHSHTGSPGRSLRQVEPKEVVRRYVETLLNKGDLSNVSQILTESCRGEEPRSDIVGRDAVVANLSRWREDFPGAHFDADQLVAEGDQVVWPWRLAALHTSGRPVDVSGVIIFRIRDGRIASYRGVYDQSELQRQLGAS